MNWEDVAAGAWPGNDVFSQLSATEQVAALKEAMTLAAARQSTAPLATYRVAAAALHLLDAYELDEARVRAILGMLLGVAAANLGKTEEAILQFRQVAEAPKHPATAIQQIQALSALGNLLITTSPAEASTLLERARAEATQMENWAVAADASISLGSLRKRAGDFECARQIYESAITALANSGVQYDAGRIAPILARLHGNLANLLTDFLGRHEEAIAHYRDAIWLFEAAGDAYFAAQRWCHLVAALFQAERYDEALDVLATGDDRCVRAPDAVVTLVQELGWVRSPAQQLPQWEALFERLLQLGTGDEPLFRVTLLAALVVLRAMRGDTPAVIALAGDTSIGQLPESRLRGAVAKVIIDAARMAQRPGLLWHLRWTHDDWEDADRSSVLASCLMEQAAGWLAEHVREILARQIDAAAYVGAGHASEVPVGIGAVSSNPPAWLQLDDAEARTFAELRAVIAPPQEALSAELQEICGAAIDPLEEPRAGAAAALKRAVIVADLIGQPVLQIQTRLWLAQSIAKDSGGANRLTFPTCSRLLNDALGLADGLPREEIRVRISLGTLFKEATLGNEAARLDRATAQLQQAFEVAVRRGASDLIAMTAIALGNALTEYPEPTEQQLDAARRYLERGLAVLEPESDPRLASTLHNSLGKAHLHTWEAGHGGEHLENAERHLRQAVSLRETEGDPSRLLLALGNLLAATIKLREQGLRGDEDITGLAARIRDAASKLPNAQGHSVALLNAVTALGHINKAEALALGLESLMLARATHSTRELVNTCVTVGRIYADLGDHGHAARVFGEGVATLEAFREEGGESHYRAALTKHYRDLHRDWFAALAAAGVPATELWSAVERCTGRTLLENMAARDAAAGAPASRLLTRLPVTLPPRTLVLQLYCDNTGIRCLALRAAAGTTHVNLCQTRLDFIALAEVEERAETPDYISLYTPAYPDLFERQLATLGAGFLQPVLAELDTTGVERVVIAAQGLEASFAWHAVPVTTTERLGDRFEVAHIPNVTMLTRLTGHPPRRVQKAVIVACDPYGTLVQHIDEALDAFSILECKEKIVLSDRSRPISADAVIDACRDADLFHFSGHSVVVQGELDQSGLILSDGTLTIPRLERSLVSSVPGLVVLSSCESAAEDAFYGDAPTLSSAFLQAGVRCVIGAAWPVPDDIAAATTRSFYGLLQLRGPVAGLAEARRAVTRWSGDPYGQSFKVSGWD